MCMMVGWVVIDGTSWSSMRSWPCHPAYMIFKWGRFAWYCNHSVSPRCHSYRVVIQSAHLGRPVTYADSTDNNGVDDGNGQKRIPSCRRVLMRPLLGANLFQSLSKPLNKIRRLEISQGGLRFSCSNIHSTTQRYNIIFSSEVVRFHWVRWS